MRTITEHTRTPSPRVVALLSGGERAATGCFTARRLAVAGLDNSVAASENEQKRPSAADCSLLALAMRRD